MTVLELCESCANTGNGVIKIFNANNVNDRAKFNSLNELCKTRVGNLKVSSWEFIPKKRIGAVDWEFVLEIMVD